MNFKLEVFLSSLLSYIIRRKEYNIYLYSFILYVYITFVISIRAREENPIGDIICVEFSSFEKPLRGF